MILFRISTMGTKELFISLWRKTTYAVYLREKKYKDNPEDNLYGKGLGITAVLH